MSAGARKPSRLSGHGPNLLVAGAATLLLLALSSRYVVYVGAFAPEALRACRLTAALRTGVDNEEDGAGVWLCDGPVGPWDEAWRHIRHYDA